jgi:hypothetical protein
MIIIIEFCENGSPGAISHQGEAWDVRGGNSHYLFKCSGLTKKQKNEPSLYIKLNTNLTQLGMKKTPILYDLLILRMSYLEHYQG